MVCLALEPWSSAARGSGNTVLVLGDGTMRASGGNIIYLTTVLTFPNCVGFVTAWVPETCMKLACRYIVGFVVE